MTDRLRLIAGVALVTSGLFGVGVGTGAYVQSWYAAWLFSRSGEAERDRADRHGHGGAARGPGAGEHRPARR